MTAVAAAASMSNATSVELHAGALRLALRADVGGAIAGFWHRDAPVLRSVEPAALGSVRDAACHPLVPYGHRIGHHRFRWKGIDHVLRADAEAAPHSLHGVGWRRPWALVSSSAVEVVLQYRHAADDDWPFAFEATQYVTLGPHSLQTEMTFVNVDERPQPVGLGWRLAFPKRARSRLHAEVAARWDTDGAGLPVRKVAQRGIDGDVTHLDFDHCFEGWSGPARIRDERFSLQLSSSLGYVVVTTPPEEDRFSVAPVGHLTNAIHMSDPLAHGLRCLLPGERGDARMHLEVAVV